MSDNALHPDEALSIVIACAPASATERVSLAESLGRAMPVEAFCFLDQPPFDKSAMDGFAYAAAHEVAHRVSGDAPAGSSGGGRDSTGADGGAGKGAAGGTLYRVVGATAAGEAAAPRLGAGEAVRIMTGAPLPAGASRVQRVEWTRDGGSDAAGRSLVLFTRPESVSNVIARGENLRSGDRLLGPRLLGPQDLGILASSGYSEVEVAKRPLVGIVSTGDEIVAAGAALGPAAIYDSNGPQLAAQAMAAGGDARFYGVFPDDEGVLREALSRALDECDIVLVSGGVSMGDFDFVPRVLESLGVKPRFHGLAMRPGKPTFFGMRGSTAAFGLPGNPVSTFVNFEILVRPHLAARLGLAWKPRILRARLAEDLVRRASDRVEFLPAALELAFEGLLARPLNYHGSSMLSVLSDAEALLRMELGVERIQAGEVVDVRLVRA
ncbi:MAG: gephyrin-like molybdotransferase Glp [Actinomycetota bacterium]